MYLNNLSFRDVYKKFVLIRETNVYEQFHEIMNVPKRCNAVFAYCYIDNEAGMTFECLCPAVYETEEVILRDDWHDLSLKIRSGYYREQDSEMKILTHGEKLLPQAFADYIEFINQNYSNKDIEVIRETTKWDPYREPDFPDDIKAMIFMNGQNKPEPEWVWVRSLRGYSEIITEERAQQMMEEGRFKDDQHSFEDYVGCIYQDGRLVGLLLNEPYSDFGVHIGDEVIITPYWHNGEMTTLIVCE